jgi:hypothetical protein
MKLDLTDLIALAEAVDPPSEAALDAALDAAFPGDALAQVYVGKAFDGLAGVKDLEAHYLADRWLLTVGQEAWLTLPLRPAGWAAQWRSASYDTKVRGYGTTEWQARLCAVLNVMKGHPHG